MPTRYPRIQVTQDPELAAALRTASSHLPPNLPLSKQVHDLAIAGAKALVGEPMTEDERRRLLEELARSFEDPPDPGFDWDLLLEVKKHAWPNRLP